MVSGGLAKLLTMNSAQKKAANQDRLGQILKNCYPWLVPTTATVDANTVEVTLPSLQLVPDGLEDVTHIMVTGEDGGKSKLGLWTELKEKKLKMIYNGVLYTDSTTETQPVLTIREGKIIKTMTGNLTVTRDLTKTGK